MMAMQPRPRIEPRLGPPHNETDAIREDGCGGETRAMLAEGKHNGPFMRPRGRMKALSQRKICHLSSKTSVRTHTRSFPGFPKNLHARALLKRKVPANAASLPHAMHGTETWTFLVSPQREDPTEACMHDPPITSSWPIPSLWIAREKPRCTYRRPRDVSPRCLVLLLVCF